ncbi:hypothetical protein BC938DRAFT_484131 [Jimgerdemannia flammicorona]|uniref:DNA polymerase beta palm domain-containing protein n=1 Tax=Jimgerdemannia flammicorona TaxID=994334 RepID=A0A433QAH8_9FUNG|nr:hypothetical protein BC938DRAFT_484131 [Jimgerdemannia flammicorona]
MIIHKSRRGANISGDLDIILTHPDFTEVEEKVVKRHKATTPLLAQAVQALEKYRFLTDFVSTGNVKYMVSHQKALYEDNSNVKVIMIWTVL